MKIGIVGYKGKIGSLLARRADFVSIDCDVTNPLSIEKELRYKKVDIIVNCAGISSIDECEKDYEKSIKVNVHGLTNLHKAFGERVLNISSDHVFDGNFWFLPTEKSVPNPLNKYGMTKFASETVSNLFGGKTIRLSRVVSIEDKDISEYLMELYRGNDIFVPDFFSRNYLHKEFVANGIEYFVRNWDAMPQLVNYGGKDNVSMYHFMEEVAIEFELFTGLVNNRKEDNKSLSPRPRKGGFKVDLARKLGFPIYSLDDTVSRMRVSP